MKDEPGSGRPHRKWYALGCGVIVLSVFALPFSWWLRAKNAAQDVLDELEPRFQKSRDAYDALLERYEDIYGEYGFYDSVHALKGTVNHQYLVLDQAMSFLAMANYLEGGVVRSLFHRDPVGQKVQALLAEEVFSI